jgi:hypothetical protein|tara:strand:+ start:283 stop:783 length:501 start_codon:yes stop_codon:yes gene_type:complete
MAEKESLFSSQLKYVGIVSFKDFYQFCYDWLTDELGMEVAEEKYTEKIKEEKDLEIKWVAEKDMTDYFRMQIKVGFKVFNLQKVEIAEGGAKVETNKGDIRLKAEGIIIRDYKGKFETTATNKFLRGIYEKWVIPSRIEEFKAKIVGNSDEFLSQAKSFLDLEGKR